MPAGAEDEDTALMTPIDELVFGPLAKLVAAPLESLPVEPSHLLALAGVLGALGGSLLRYAHVAELLPAALLLLLYAVLDAASAALAEERGVDPPGARDLVAGGVSLACAVFASVRIGPTGGASAVLAITVGLGSALLQAELASAMARRAAGAAPRGPIDAALRRIAPIPPELVRKKAKLRRAPWAWLGRSTHFVLLAVAIVAGLLEAYLWARLIAVTLAILLLLEQLRREHAATPPPEPRPAGTDAADATPSGETKPAEGAEAPVAARDLAPISFRPPPDA